MAGTRGKGGAPQTGPRAAGSRGGAKPAKTARERAAESKIIVDGTAYALGDLELGELGELEDHVGLPMDAISFGSAKVIAYVIYLVRRRDNPKYTLDDASHIKISAITSDAPDDEEIVGAVGDRPTTPSEG